jgi:hypothetical protein
MMTQAEFEEAMNDRDFIEDQERDERVREAAHEMLAALEAVLDHVTPWNVTNAMVRAAIRKAKEGK